MYSYTITLPGPDESGVSWVVYKDGMQCYGRVEETINEAHDAARRYIRRKAPKQKTISETVVRSGS